MRRKATRRIVIHCSATRPHMDVGAREIDQWHKRRGFDSIGYHFVIRRDGSVETGRDLRDIGAHAKGFNATSVGVCLVGGIAMNGRPQNNFTPEQFDSLKRIVLYLKSLYPNAEVLGHRDLSPDRNGDGEITPDEWVKECPCFSARDWWKSVLD